MISDLLIQGNHEITTLRGLVGLYFKIDPESIGSIYDTEENHEINIEIYDIRGDFDTRLCVYENILPNVKGVDFAIFLSYNLNNDVLMSHWENNPYLWILVQPNSQLYKVINIPNEEESESLPFFLELDKAFKEELNLSDVRQHFE